MTSEKKYTAKEAAVAVLKKAEELLKASDLAKADDMMYKPNLGKSDVSAPDGIQPQVAPDTDPKQALENQNPPAGATPPFVPVKAIASAKLAKFMEHRHAKKKAKASMDKGEGVERDAGAPLHRKVGYDKQGDKVSSQIAAEGAKDNHVKKLAEIKAAPKPKLPG